MSLKITCFFFFSFIVWFFRHFVFLYISFCISCLTRIADVTPHIRISTSIDYSTTTRPRPNAFISMLSSVLLLLLLTFFFLMCQFNDTSATTASHSICWHLDNSKKYGTKKKQHSNCTGNEIAPVLCSLCVFFASLCKSFVIIEFHVTIFYAPDLIILSESIRTLVLVWQLASSKLKRKSVDIFVSFSLPRSTRTDLASLKLTMKQITRGNAIDFCRHWKLVICRQQTKHLTFQEHSKT